LKNFSRKLIEELESSLVNHNRIRINEKLVDEKSDYCNNKTQTHEHEEYEVRFLK
jgi:hypothetical protein